MARRLATGLSGPMLCLGLALLLGIFGASRCGAVEATVLAAAFQQICYARPDSLESMSELARVQRFVPSSGKPSPSDDPFNIMLMWRRGEGATKLGLVGITSGSADKYHLGCWMDGNDVAPEELLNALKLLPGMGNPEVQPGREGLAVATWTLPGDPHHGIVNLEYDPKKGRQSLSLQTDRVLGGRTPK